jgi:hypothetical protein
MTKVVDISKSPVARGKLVDELGRLTAKYRRWEKDIKRLAELKKLVAAFADADGFEPDQESVHHGKHYVACISAREFERKIVDMEGVLRAVGEEMFLKQCSFGLAKLDVLVPDALGMELITRERTGSRKVEVEPKQPKLVAA